MSSTLTHPFTTETNYTFDSNKVEFVAGEAKLKVGQDRTGESWVEPYDSNVGFTYDAGLANFASGTLSHIAPTNLLSTIKYDLNDDLSYNSGVGSSVGTPTGTTAITNARLDLTPLGVASILYASGAGTSVGNIWSIKFKYTPNYSGTPASSLALVGGGTGGDIDEFYFRHHTDGNLSGITYDDGGSLNEWAIAAWAPVSGTTYEMLFCHDSTNGLQNIFIDGILHATDNKVYNKLTVGGLTIGARVDGTLNSNCFMEDVVIYNDIQETAPYTPGYNLNAIESFAPGDCYSSANFDTNFDLTVCSDDSAVTPTVGAGIVITDGRLDMTAVGINKVEWLDAYPLHTAFSIKMKFTPNYSGSPASNRYLYTYGDNGSNNNRIFSRHEPTGNLRTYFNDFTASPAGSLSFAWVPVAGQTYEFLWVFDTSGFQAVFLDGVLKDSKTVVFTRTTPQDYFTINQGGQTHDYFVDDIVLFNDIQETSSYTPGYTLGETVVATYKETVNLDVSRASIIPTVTGSAVITGGELDLSFNDLSSLKYAGVNLGELWTIKFLYTPNYNTANSSLIDIISFADAGSSKNRMYLRHATNSELTLTIYDRAGSVGYTTSASTFVTTLGTSYEIMITNDSKNGNQKIFIDGVIGGTGTSSFVFGGSNPFLVGTDGFSETQVSNFTIKDLMIFTDIQETTNYIPGYDPRVWIADETTIVLPTRNYSGLGTLQAYEGLTAVETGTNKYLVNGEYWDGSAWATSTLVNRFQASSLADINTNLPTLTALQSMDVTVFFEPSDAPTASLSQNTFLYTGQQYWTDNPSILVNDINYMSELLSYSIVSTEVGSDLIKGIVQSDSIDKYWDTSAWSTSTGYAQSNTPTEINDNGPALLDGRAAIRMKVYLHSADGLTTPSIDSLTYTYDNSIDPLTQVTVNVAGVVHVNLDPDVGNLIKVRPYPNGYLNGGIFYKYAYKTVGTINPDGHWNGYIVQNPAGTFIEIKIGKESWIIDLSSVSVIETVLFADLNPQLVEV